MGKKNKRGNKKKQAKEDKEVLPEVDKEFYELQLTDLNQKLSRLRSRCSELESENDDIKKSLQKLDDDRADIIAYLKRTLQAKADEIAELQERLIALQQARKAEEKVFLEKIKKMEHEYKVMHEQLNSEIKLLNGKLNSLEEFRREREDLTNKFNELERTMEEQENIHEVALYEIERKFIIGKDELKKDMENKLLQLSLDFHNTTDIRIATTTSRVIRENIAISNEINIITESWKAFLEEKVDLKKREKELKTDAEIQKELNKTLIKKNSVLIKLVEKITSAQRKVQDSFRNMDEVLQHGITLEGRLETALADLRKKEDECERLRQTVQSRLAEECQHEMDLELLQQHCYKLQDIVTTAAHTVNQALKVQVNPDADEAYNLRQRESLLTSLLELCAGVDCVKVQPSALRPWRATMSQADMALAYSTGDLGLISKINEGTT